MSESVWIRSFVDAAKNAEDVCRSRQDENVRTELFRVLKNIADSNGQLTEAGKSLSVLAENLNDVADPPDQVGRIVVAFVRKLLGEVRIPGEHNSTDSDSLLLLEFSRLFEHARVLCEKDEPSTQSVLSSEASDEDVLSWLGVLDNEVSSRNELISEYVDFIASVFRSLQEEGTWDKRTSLGNEKRLLEIASTYETRKQMLEEREKLERKHSEREEREQTEVGSRIESEQERQCELDDVERYYELNPPDGYGYGEVEQRQQEEVGEEGHIIKGLEHNAGEKQFANRVRNVKQADSAKRKAPNKSKGMRSGSLIESERTNSKAGDSSLARAIEKRVIPLWAVLLVMLLGVGLIGWIIILVIGWAFHHWMISVVSVGVLLSVICVIRMARWVGDRMRSDDWDDDDEGEPAGELDD